MSDHHHDHHADHHGHDHGHDDHGHGADRPYFDDSTSILAPVYIVIALLVIFGTLFFG